MSALNDFSLAGPRPLPVIVLADVSGSMKKGGKIDALNSAVADMISAFAKEPSDQVQFHVAVITFGRDGAQLHQPMDLASRVKWRPLEAGGKTPMGGAFELALGILEDHDQVPSRAFAPSLVLVSDGKPNDEWETPLLNLMTSKRGAKADRFAMAIGDDADLAMLVEFLGGKATRAFAAHEARGIKNFFRRVTMTTIVRSQSASPDEPIEFPPPDPDDF